VPSAKVFGGPHTRTVPCARGSSLRPLRIRSGQMTRQFEPAVSQGVLDAQSLSKLDAHTIVELSAHIIDCRAEMPSLSSSLWVAGSYP
jgi:hypothetical protein